MTESKAICNAQDSKQSFGYRALGVLGMGAGPVVVNASLWVMKQNRDIKNALDRLQYNHGRYRRMQEFAPPLEQGIIGHVIGDFSTACDELNEVLTPQLTSCTVANWWAKRDKGGTKEITVQFKQALHHLRRTNECLEVAADEVFLEQRHRIAHAHDRAWPEGFRSFAQVVDLENASRAYDEVLFLLRAPRSRMTQLEKYFSPR